MKRMLPVVIALTAIALTVALLYAGTVAVWRRAGQRPWPMTLGTLQDFDKQFPKQGTSAAATELVRLARPLRIDFTPKAKNADTTHKAINEYTKVHHSRNTAAVDPLPAEIAAFLAQHERDLDAVRAHLLQHGNELAWPSDLSKGFETPLPNLLAHLHLARVLIVRALTRGNGDDLHAAEMLGRSLHTRPDTISQLIALAIARQVNSAAWKLPPPAPPWLAEMGTVDRRRLLLRAVQGDTWVLWRFGHESEDLPFGFAGRPYFRACTANMANHQRETAIQLAAIEACGFDGETFDLRRRAELPPWNIIAKIAVPNFGAMWARVLRYDVEREVVADALRIRGGQPPPARAPCPVVEKAEGSPPMPLDLRAGER